MLNWYNRKCNIINWMPDKVKGTREAQVFAEIMACPEVKQLNTYTYMIYLMNNIDLLKEDSPGSLQVIEYLEKLYGIVPVEGSTWEDRYFAILMYLRDKRECTLRRLVSFIGEITEEDNITEVRTNFLQNNKTYIFNGTEGETKAHWNQATFPVLLTNQHQFRNKQVTFSAKAVGSDFKADLPIGSERFDIGLEFTFKDGSTMFRNITDFSPIFIPDDTYVTLDEYINLMNANALIPDENYHIGNRTIIKRTMYSEALSTTFTIPDKEITAINCLIRCQNKIVKGSLEISELKLELGDKYTGYSKGVNYDDSYRIFAAERFDIMVSTRKQELILMTNLDTAPKLVALKSALEEIVPLNFTIDIRTKYNTHNDLRPFVHTQLSDKTHKEVREGDISKWT